jgi:PadR family transcriptional regulator AphA
MTSLTPTGRLILGMIRLGKRTGYEIKQLADVSTRFFWSTSYGQIYPELKRLEEAGLVESEDDPVGGRARTVHSLTDEGERVLDEWLAAREELIWELRDEALLKLFFSDGRDPDEIQANMRAARERSEAIVAGFRELKPDLGDPEPGSLMVLRYGIEFNEWLAAWWAREEKRVGRQAKAAARG